MSKNRHERGMDRRAFIKMSSGAVVAVSGNWFLPRISLGAEEEIRIGGLCELSGAASIMGTEQASAMELAVDMYNQKGGVLGRKLQLIMEDTESKKDVGLAKARRLVERSKAHYLAGIIYSSVSMAIQNYIREKRVLFVNSGSGNDALIQPPYCDRYFFKCPGSFRLTCLAIREPAKRLDKWYFLADDYSWGKGCVEYFKKSIALVKPDFKTVGEDYPPFGETNYAPYLTKVMAAQPDGLAIANFGAGWARAIKQARQMGLKCHIHHQFWDLNNARATGDAVLGITSSSEFLNENPKAPRAKVFTDAYQERFGRYPGGLAAYGFHAIEVIMEAVKAAGTTDTEAVIDAMESLTYAESILSPDYHFRKADHQSITGLYTIEAIQDPKYQYGTKILDYDPDPTLFVVPENETGCDEYMKKRA
jgi:branched-chain amino acid transport system substrate-binding protein